MLDQVAFGMSSKIYRNGMPDVLIRKPNIWEDEQYDFEKRIQGELITAGIPTLELYEADTTSQMVIMDDLSLGGTQLVLSYPDMFYFGTRGIDISPLRNACQNRPVVNPEMMLHDLMNSVIKANEAGIVLKVSAPHLVIGKDGIMRTVFADYEDGYLLGRHGYWTSNHVIEMYLGAVVEVVKPEIKSMRYIIEPFINFLSEQQKGYEC